MSSRVLITGAAGGIGRALSSRFTAAGYDVIATARNVDALADVPCHQRVGLDVTDPVSVRDALAAAGEIHVLVNNAGTGAGGPTEHIPIAAARRVFDVNFFGAALMIHGLLPQMRARGRGVIVAISSMSACLPWPFGSYYSASKAAMESLHEAVAIELGTVGIRVIIAEPGVVDTRFGDKFESYGSGAAAYEPLASVWADQFNGPHIAPETVAEEVVTCVLTTTSPLTRLPIGDEAKQAITARAELSSIDFLAWFGERHNLPPGAVAPRLLSTDVPA